MGVRQASRRARATRGIAVALTLAWLVGLSAASGAGRTYYVDANDGNDAASGGSASTAWRTLAKVSGAPLVGGDTVLLKRGGTWRGQLVPHSGEPNAPITYAAYGKGPKPLLLGSVGRSRPGDWHRQADGIWTTAPLTFAAGPVLRDLGLAEWGLHREAGAAVTMTRQPAPATGGATASRGATYRIDCMRGGSAGNHVQLSVMPLAVRQGKCYSFAFRARCTRPFRIASIVLMRQGSPWTPYGEPMSGLIAVGTEWADCVARFRCGRTADDGRITLLLGQAIPADATLLFQPGTWRTVQPSGAGELNVDVGNIIFDDGAATGVKKWSPQDLKRDGDYWYDAAGRQVKLCSPGNPAERHRGIELALRRHIIDEGGRSWVTYEGLALWYGAAHGIGGGGTSHVTVRDCDVSFIGGGHQLTGPDGRPVRFGNGIEFWADARDNLVERCRLWEVYDAALTNQGSGQNVQRNITYRHNAIWNCEYSFEYWNRDERSRTANIRFEHNTCVRAGGGWGHAQRPDRNGRHLMFYSNTARTDGVVVEGNIFCDATDSCLRLDQPDWSAGLKMDRNVWHQASGPLILWLGQSFGPDQFDAFRRLTGQGAHSIMADPRFVDAAQCNWRLAGDSPARALCADGSPAGAISP